MYRKLYLSVSSNWLFPVDFRMILLTKLRTIQVLFLHSPPINYYK